MKHLSSYRWSGLDRNGAFQSGSIQASSKAMALKALQERCVLVRTLSKNYSAYFQGIKGQSILHFWRELSLMLNAGLPLIAIFKLLVQNESNASFRCLLAHIQENLEAGRCLSESLAEHPLVFDALLCNLLAAGEQSGTLEQMLERILIYQLKNQKLKKKLQQACLYPCTIVLVACLVTGFLLFFVVPQFETIYQGFGAKLPAMTAMVVAFSQVLKNFWPLMLCSSIAVGLAFFSAKKHNPAFAKKLEALALKLPFLGQCLQKTILARFTRTLSITFAGGLPWVLALEASAGVCAHHVYVQALHRIQKTLSEGQNLHQAMENTGLFPRQLIQLVRTGEETAALPKMLEHAADYYEEALEHQIAAFSALLEPCMMSFLGLILGTLVLAMYLPVFQLGSIV